MKEPPESGTAPGDRAAAARSARVKRRVLSVSGDQGRRQDAERAGDLQQRARRRARGAIDARRARRREHARAILVASATRSYCTLRARRAVVSA